MENLDGFLKLNIAPHASGNQARGHFHWMHKTLSDKLGFLTISHKSSDAEFSSPLLSDFYGREITPVANVLEDVWSISEFVKRQKNVQNILFHIYEGNLQSILLAGILLKEFPNSRALVNLHWADQIANGLESNIFEFQILKKSVKRILSIKSSRLFVTAESKCLAEFANLHLGTEIEEYPVFSVYDVVNKVDIKPRNDLLVSPSSLKEFLEIQEITRPQLKMGKRIVFNLPNFLVNNSEVRSEIQKAKLSGFEVYEGNLTAGEYSTLVGDSKKILLAYDHDFYKWGSSGKLLDSIRLGCSVVVPNNLAFSHAVVNNAWGVTYEKGSNLELQRALDSDFELSSTAQHQALGVEAFAEFICNHLELFDQDRSKHVIDDFWFNLEILKLKRRFQKIDKTAQRQ